MSDGNLFIHNFGGKNFFAGENAGNLAMAGTVNTATGLNALRTNTKGDRNTATGGGALQGNTTGNNTANGESALQSNTTGFNNTAVGSGALSQSSTGSGNTAAGHGALIFNITGSNNTAFGRSALESNTTGYGNTAIGRFADVSASDLTNATAIGANAVVDASNKIRLGDDAVSEVEAAGSFHTIGGGFIAGATTTYGDGTIDLSAGTDLNIDAGTLFIDSTNDRVGVGIVSPNSTLEVAGVIHSTAGGIKFPDSSIQTTASTGSIMIANSRPGGNQTHLVVPGACDSLIEAQCKIPAPRSGTLANLFVIPDIVPATGSNVSITLRINGVDTALSVTQTEADGTGVKSNTIDIVNINNGDLRALVFTENAGIGVGNPTYRASFEFKWGGPGTAHGAGCPARTTGHGTAGADAGHDCYLEIP